MRIFKSIQASSGVAIIALMLHFAPSGGIIGTANAQEYAKPKRAFEQGIRDYRTGDLNKAIKALEYAAGKGHFRAKFYLARIYATNTGPYTNHSRSYQLYQAIVDQYAEIDPLFNMRAPYVARAIVELARYLKAGVPALDMEADAGRAAAYLDHAAKYFGDREAQYELAKMYLSGDGVAKNSSRGKHWLSTLARNRHAEAQAYLGDLYWSGEYIERNQIKGMAYVMLALENAQAHNRVWIEELYQKIYCQSTTNIRRDATLVASNLRAKQPRKKRMSLGAKAGLDLGDFQTTRTCRNGEQVAMPEIPHSGGGKPVITRKPTGDGSTYYGVTSGGFGLRNVGSGSGRQE